MIHIEDKHNCCGCSACQQICPKKCISFEADYEGFLYPSVNREVCIECGLCERVCPVLNQGDIIRPISALAAKNRDEYIRANSSSGGIFYALAEKTIKEGGVVYGARFNEELSVVHGVAYNLEDISEFRGSKYLQSMMNDTFKDIRSALNKGIKVLFSGTPCQVAGLRNFLQKSYDNLTLIDFVCHGVPSPSVWQNYLHSFSNISIDSAAFRDKEQGWHRFGLRLNGANRSDASGWHRFGIFSDDHYMQVFLSNLSLRPSCYSCPSKRGKSGSDITLGDFWGIEHIDPEIDDDKGTSLVLINTLKGEKFFKDLNIGSKEESYEEALKFNPSMEVSVDEPEKRAKFFHVFSHSGFNAAYKATMIPSLPFRLKRKLKSLAGQILGEKGKQIVRMLKK